MRITALTIENFKGIREPARIEFKPVTLLYGPNSAGKSTIMQALHYAHELLERQNADADLTARGGEFVDLGGFENFVYGHELSRQVKIRLDLDLEESPEDSSNRGSAPLPACLYLRTSVQPTVEAVRRRGRTAGSSALQGRLSTARWRRRRRSLSRPYSCPR